MTTDQQWKAWETKFRRMNAEQQEAALAALTPEQRLHFEQIQSQRAKSTKSGMIGLLIVLAVFVVPFILWIMVTYESAEDRQERRQRARAARAEKEEREAEQLKIPTGRHFDAAYSCRDFVKSRLTSPKTAEFPSIWTGERKDAEYLGESKYRLESWVDAQNAFGVTLRTPYVCTVLYDSGQWILVELNVGAEEIRAAQLERDRLEVQRLERLRLAEQPEDERVVSPFDPFSEEVAAIRKAAQCTNAKTTPPGFGLGALFGCIEGTAQTAKLFINEERNTGQVENVKVMWNDWFRDVGYGLHADREEAERLLVAVVSRYAPNQLERISRAYFERQFLTIEEGYYRLVVSHNRGPDIDEHLLTVTGQTTFSLQVPAEAKVDRTGARDGAASSQDRDEQEARFEAYSQAEHERQAVDEDLRRQEKVPAATEELSKFRARAIEERRKRQEELLLEQERQEAEARRLEREHHQQTQRWHEASYSPGIASFKGSLASFYDAYRAASPSTNLTDACKELKLQIVAVRRNSDLMNSPDREINLRLQAMLGTFDAVVVACTNGSLTEMRSKLGNAEAAIGRLAESLTRFSLTP